MRNKYTNKALEGGHKHFNTYLGGSTGYVARSSYTGSQLLLGLLLVLTVVILGFHFLSKYFS